MAELIEEWEQCEKKLKEVRVFIDKTSQALDVPSGKKKTLSEQLASKEKIVADVLIQKNKTNMSVEKLEVGIVF